MSIQPGTAAPALTYTSAPAGTLARLAWRARHARRPRPLVEVTPPPGDIKVEWNVPVVLRDGVTLRVNVFRPATDEPVPAILSAHPYGKDKIPVNGRKGTPGRSGRSIRRGSRSWFRAVSRSTGAPARHCWHLPGGVKGF